VIGQRHVGAAFREDAGDMGADAAVGAGHEHDPAGEVDHRTILAKNATIDNRRDASEQAFARKMGL